MVLMDASKLGTTVKEGKAQRTLLSPEEEARIIDVFNRREPVADLSVVVNRADVEAKNYSFSAGQYFEVKMDHVDITADEFSGKLTAAKGRLAALFAEGENLEEQIISNFARIFLKA